MTQTILIVEDNELNMKLLNDVLTVQGYRILKAVNGTEALTMAGENQPDLILMDIQLPDISGLEIIKWLKESESTQAVPVIAVTAFAMAGDEARIRKSGCEEYISKPINLPTLLSIIRKLMPERSTDAPRLVAWPRDALDDVTLASP
jgi:two-component system cell cycle response regulator DivK